MDYDMSSDDMEINEPTRPWSDVRRHSDIREEWAHKPSYMTSRNEKKNSRDNKSQPMRDDTEMERSPFHDDMPNSTRDSVIDPTDIKTYFNSFETNLVFMKTPRPDWTYEPDPSILSEPDFVKAWHTFKRKWQKVKKEYEAREPPFQAPDLAAKMTKAITKLDKVYSAHAST
jgi:hypothetical protein